MNTYTLHATADNLTYEQLVARSGMIIRPDGGRPVYTSGYTRRMFNKDAKTPKTTTCKPCNGSGTRFDVNYLYNAQCGRCTGYGFLFNK
jgi:hypothetical protein